MNALQWFFFWNSKSPKDNQWHPQPGRNPTKHIGYLPAALTRMDIEATVVDVAPFVAGAGGIAHISQINSFGFTASPSVFRNVRTLTAMHRTVVFLAPAILAFQAAGFDYRYFIPRWAHEREMGRGEVEVRQHVDAGMKLGSFIWVARMIFKLGARFWAPIDIVMGGALADLMHREYIRAHSQSPAI